MAEPVAALRLEFLTAGDFSRLTGGHLYNRRMVEAAGARSVVVSVHSLRKSSLGMSLLEGRRALRRLPPADGILIDSLAAAGVAPWLRAVRDAMPVVAVVHQQPGGSDHGPTRARLQARLDLLAYRQADRLIVTSEFLAKRLINEGVGRSRVCVVPPGRDLPSANPAASSELRAGRQAALVCICNWIRNKAIHLLLEAVASLQSDMTTLHLVGDPSVDPAYAEQLRRRLAAPDLRERVIVWGRRPPTELASILGAADIAVHPSRTEAYGMAVSEAMATGLPVVAFRIDNIPYLVRDGVDGILVEDADVPALAAALAVLIRDPQRRHAMGVSAKARAMAWPTWAQTSERFWSVVRETAAAPR